MRILDDLGVKASDIFQANGIVWVEGPSDRIYIKKWLRIIDPELEENEHFSFVYYGGKLLSHYSACEEDEMIDLLLVNRNSAIVMDSDIKVAGGTINKTKKRITEEFGRKKLFCWTTEGREIENYIHFQSVKNAYGIDCLTQIGKYQDFKDYVSEVDDTFESHKVQTAEKLEFDETMLDVLDLKQRIKSLSKTIRSWNLIPKA